MLDDFSFLFVEKLITYKNDGKFITIPKTIRYISI